MAQLAKLSSISAAIRNAALQKKAGVLGAVGSVAGKAAVKAGKVAVKHPVKTLVGASVAAGSIGQARQFNEGFNPNAREAHIPPYGSV